MNAADQAIPPGGFFFATAHQIHFSNREPVPVKQIAESLLALEGIIRASPRVLSGLTHVDVSRIEVYVDKIESGSLLENVIIKLFFKTEEDLNAFLEKVGEKIRQPGMPRNVLIGTVIAALVGYGAYWAARANSQPGQTTITANNNTIISLGAGRVDLTPEAFSAIIEAAVVDKKDLARNAVRLFQPARADREARIVIDDNDATSFSAEVIRQTPRKLEFDDSGAVRHFSDVDLQIRATDRDSLSRGWAAVLPGLIERRVRLKLDPSVKPAEIADKFSVRADVSVYYRLDKAQKKQIPDHILLREVIRPEAP